MRQSKSLVPAATLLACALGAAAAAQPRTPSAESVGGRHELMAYIENDQAEFAVRLMKQRSNRYTPETRRAVYDAAVASRLQQEEEGAVVDLLLAAPPGVDDVRAHAARALAGQWRRDPSPDLRSLRRRLTWCRALQRSITPAPIDSELPVTLTLLTLDQIDRVDHPDDLFAALEIAERVAPNNLVWSSYYPDETYRLYTAEALARRGEFLEAAELYRRLAIDVPERSEWLRRKLAQTQVDRVTTLSATRGAEVALRAASLVRVEFLSAEEQSRFRAQESMLRQAIADEQSRRRLPQTITTPLHLEPLPVAYTINDETYVGAGAALTFGPGSVLRGGRLILEGGAVSFNGTPEQPVIVTGVTFATSDATGGVVFGSNVHFRECTWPRTSGSTGEGPVQWTMQSTFSHSCEWRFSPAVAIQWGDSEFVGSRVYLQSPPTSPAGAAANSSVPEDHGFTRCHFFDGAINEGALLNSKHCGFTDVQLEWTTKLIDAQAAELPIVVAPNFYEPAGLLPSVFNRTAPFAEGAGPVTFERLDEAPFIGLGRVRSWVD